MTRRTWLFQTSPDRFDIDGFLATRPLETSWLVTRFADKITPGDQVFMWRAVGSGDRELSGVYGESEVISRVERRADDPAEIPFWKNAADGRKVAPRIRLRIVRVANRREFIKRDWLEEDPILRRMDVLTIRRPTNYELQSEEAARLNALWAKTGRDWSYAEAVAGLWAYHHTLGEKVSKREGSAVATVALLIGRGIGSVYNKVMNFRSLDPRDQRAGMPGVSRTDREVWTKFYDSAATTLRADELEAEFERLWGADIGSAAREDAGATQEAIEEEARRLTRLSLSDLLAKYEANVGKRSCKPRARTAATRVYERDPYVIAIAKVRADFKCEVRGCAHPVFLDASGVPYCEVHHIDTLAHGGDDVIENVVCLCPAHHREAHYGREGGRLRQEFRNLRLVRKP